MIEGTASAAVFGYGPLYMRQVLGEPSLAVTTLMLALTGVVWFGFAALWGRLGDRFGNPLPLVAWSLAFSAAGLALLPMASGSAAFIAGTVFWSAVQAAVVPLGVSWLTLLCPERPSEAAAGLYRMRFVGWTLGSMGTGALISGLDLAGISLGYWLTAGLAGGSALWSAATVRRRQVAEPSGRAGAGPIGFENASWAEIGQLERGSTSRQAARASAGTIWQFRAVTALCTVIMLTSTGNEAFFAVIGPYLTEYLDGAPEWLGLSLGAASLLGVGIIGPLGRAADRRGPEQVFVAGCWAYAIMYGIMTVWRDPVVAAVLFGLPVFPFLSTGATGSLARRTPVERRGEAVGVYEGTSALAGALGSLLGGMLADAAGLDWIPAMSFVLSVVGLLVARSWLLPGEQSRQTRNSASD